MVTKISHDSSPFFIISTSTLAILTSKDEVSGGFFSSPAGPSLLYIETPSGQFLPTESLSVHATLLSSRGHISEQGPLC